VAQWLTLYAIYQVDHKKRPLFTALATVCNILTCHANEVTQDVTEKYWMK